jgi:hypothetical protein
MKEIKVDSVEECPFRDGGYFNSVCTIREDADCCGPEIPAICPLRKESVIVNVGSLGMADVKGEVKK